MCQNMGIRCSNIKPLKYPLDSGKILRIFLSLLQQSRVVRIQKQLADLTAQGKGCHILLRRQHVFVNNRGSGFYRIGHLVGNIIFNHGSSVGRYNQPKQRHPYQGDYRGNDSNPCGKFFIFYESHKSFPHWKRLQGQPL